MNDNLLEQERLERNYSIKTFYHAILGSLVIYAFIAGLYLKFGLGEWQTFGYFILSLSISAWWFLHLRCNSNRNLHHKVGCSKRYYVVRDVTLLLSAILFCVFMVYWCKNLPYGFGDIIGEVFGLLISIILFGLMGVGACYAWSIFWIMPPVDKDDF